MNFKAPNINDKIKKKKAHKFSEMSKLQVFFRILFFAWFTKFNSYALNIYATTDTFPCINTHWFAHIFDIFHKIKHEKKKSNRSIFCATISNDYLLYQLVFMDIVLSIFSRYYCNRTYMIPMSLIFTILFYRTFKLLTHNWICQNIHWKIK